MSPRRPPEKPAANRRASARALGEVDGPRGQRDGRNRAARARVQGRRRLMVGLAATVILVGVLFVAVFPARTYFDQQAATKAAEAELREVREERAAVRRESERLETPEEIEKRAREEFGYKKPGEETYNILPAPAEPIGLPESWPFTGVERALGAR